MKYIFEYPEINTREGLRVLLQIMEKENLSLDKAIQVYEIKEEYMKKILEMFKSAIEEVINA